MSPGRGLTCPYLPAAPGSSPEPLACIEWESIEVIVKTSSRSKCYIEFHSYCLEGEVALRGAGLSAVCHGGEPALAGPVPSALPHRGPAEWGEHLPEL